MSDTAASDATDISANREPLTALLEIFTTPEGHADPHSRYRLLHEQAPVLVTPNGDIFLSRFDDCNELLRDNRFIKGPPEDRFGGSDDAAEWRRQRAKEQAHIPNSMLGLNPPDHTRIRGLVSRAFTPRRVEVLRESMVELADECFERMADLREFDLLEELGFPFPVAVIGEMLGIPRPDWPRFRHLTSAAAMSLETTATVEQLEEAKRCNKETWDYFTSLVAEKRAHPDDAMISGMLEVADGSDKLDEAELIVNANLMFAAGFETTTNLIGNGMGALLRNPDQFAKLRAEPELLPRAVEEMLRWDSPVQIDGRQCGETTEFAGLTVEKGTRIRTLLGAANRDPGRFSDPDAFDIARDEGAPMSFASGIHYCLGANLSRAEGQVVFSGLLDRFSSIELTGELVNRPRVTLRGYESVPVKVTPK